LRIFTLAVALVVSVPVVVHAEEPFRVVVCQCVQENGARQAYPNMHAQKYSCTQLCSSAAACKAGDEKGCDRVNLALANTEDDPVLAARFEATKKAALQNATAAAEQPAADTGESASQR
jgi:hypothetical protein